MPALTDQERTGANARPRVGQPEGITRLVSFLVSEGAGYVSGQVIYAAGGPRT